MSGNKINSSVLTDRFGRKHSYLRLSITDACNFACTYCMPDNKQCELTGNKMSAREIIELASAFHELGVTKIRLTGGEPTVHPEFSDIIEGLGKIPAELALTTNGYLLEKHFNHLYSNGVRNINFSLDTLRSSRFKAITNRNAFDKVFANLILAIKIGFDVKLNAVIMRGTNEDEIIDFAELTRRYPLTVRFIEFMPFKDNNWNFGKSFTEADMLEKLRSRYEITEFIDSPEEKANYYTLPNAQGKVGMISTLSHPFCENCNRLRVTADGRLKNCLFGKEEYNLVENYRNGQPIIDVLKQALLDKADVHGGNKTLTHSSPQTGDNRNMYSIGG